MSATALQPSFADLGTPLSEVDLVVVDLETTGSTEDCSITEVGAVRVRGGEVLGEFQTLVRPDQPIPALVAVLTGITNGMVATAPPLAAVLPSFLQFAAGATWVAHNASFDVGFLRRACEQLDQPWPAPRVFDTVALSRSILLRDEVANHKLQTLARHFASPTTPNHRALTDARATVDVLHGLLERVGNLGVHTVEDLVELTRRVSPQRRAKRVWATDVPRGPGVYLFHTDGAPGDGRPAREGREVLYVGTSVNLRSRVRSYFTAAERRPRMEEMIRVATGVETISCSTALQAEVLELRLIAAHRPRYNRRSKHPERQLWLKVTVEAFPRLSVVRRRQDDEATYLGPFRGRAEAELALLCLQDVHPLRRCTGRIRLRQDGSACALAGMGRCCSPCDGSVDREAYAEVVQDVRASMGTDLRAVLSGTARRLTRLAEQQRFEEAAVVRSRAEALQRAVRRQQRVESLSRCRQVVAARRTEAGWEIHVLRWGRLAAAALAVPGEVPQAVARSAV
ncbi:DEDD exonuclease domain-containing protein, partial [Desertihabitans aurantiacus]|uniref:DEDD exonuclease domain-containing protein n=1 Tax=Desertihabitans aurantiacus TaxID=2282477 RepID=UPI000DF7B45E